MSQLGNDDNAHRCGSSSRSVGPVSLRANRYINGRLDRWAFVVRHLYPGNEADIQGRLQG